MAGSARFGKIFRRKIFIKQADLYKAPLSKGEKLGVTPLAIAKI